MPDAIDLPTWASDGLRITAILLVALVAFLFVRTAITVAVGHLLERREGDTEGGLLSAAELERRVTTLKRLAIRVAGGLIAIIAGLMVLSTFQIDIGPAIAGLGVAGIAVGLGAQTLVRDWLAGIFVVVENQYSQGDVVEIAGVSGVVEDFSLRRTTLRDLNGTVHTVPNGAITVASNMTRVWARVNLDISVGYDTDIDRAIEIVNRIGAEMKDEEAWRTRMIEAPTVLRVDSLGESGVTLKILGQVRAAEQWSVGGELRKRILRAFSEEGIEIPFPHRVMIQRGGA